MGVSGYDLLLAVCGWVWANVNFIWLGAGGCE